MEKNFVKHIKKVDPVLYKILETIEELPKINKRSKEELFISLVSEIISQQLSGRVADVIFNRFKNLFPQGAVTPRLLLNVSHETLRSVGMSNAKAKYVKDLAEKVISQELVLETLYDLENEEVIMELTKVKGIGKWTAEMFLMFSLGREDVFSHGDLGLKNALKKIYNIENPTNTEVENITKKWSPYRTYACLILWKSLEVKS